MSVKVVTSINFDEPPPPGTILVYRAQRFVSTGHEPHRRRDGLETTLIVWSGYCAECGCDITVKSGLKSSNPKRRCDAHAIKGKRVVCR